MYTKKYTNYPLLYRHTNHSSIYVVVATNSTCVLHLNSSSSLPAITATSYYSYKLFIVGHDKVGSYSSTKTVHVPPVLHAVGPPGVSPQTDTFKQQQQQIIMLLLLLLLRRQQYGWQQQQQQRRRWFSLSSSLSSTPNPLLLLLSSSSQRATTVTTVARMIRKSSSSQQQQQRLLSYYYYSFSSSSSSQQQQQDCLWKFQRPSAATPAATSFSFLSSSSFLGTNSSSVVVVAFRNNCNIQNKMKTRRRRRGSCITTTRNSSTTSTSSDNPMRQQQQKQRRRQQQQGNGYGHYYYSHPYTNPKMNMELQRKQQQHPQQQQQQATMRHHQSNINNNMNNNKKNNSSSSFYHRIAYYLQGKVPLGAMTFERIQFCQSSIEWLSKQPPFSLSQTQQQSQSKQSKQQQQSQQQSQQPTLTTTTTKTIDEIRTPNFVIPTNKQEQMILAQALLERLAQEVDYYNEYENHDESNLNSLSTLGSGNDATTTTPPTSTPRLTGHDHYPHHHNLYHHDHHHNHKKNNLLTVLLPMRCYVHVLRGWASIRSQDALVHVFDLYDQLQQRWKKNKNKNKKNKNHYNGGHSPPNDSIYSSLLYACGICNHPQARIWADNLMQSLEQEAQQEQQLQEQPQQPMADTKSLSSSSLLLPTHLYNEWILVHASRAGTEYGAAAKAEDILLHMSQLAAEAATTTTKTTTTRLGPTTDSFNRVLRAWVESPENKSLDRARHILQLMIQLYHNHKHDDDHVKNDDATTTTTCTTTPNTSHSSFLLRPTPQGFYMLIAAHAKRQEPEYAEQIWDMAIQHYFNQDNNNRNNNKNNQTTRMTNNKNMNMNNNMNNNNNKKELDNDNHNHHSTTTTTIIDLTDCFNATLFAWVNSCCSSTTTTTSSSSSSSSSSRNNSNNHNHKENDNNENDPNMMEKELLFQKATDAVERLFHNVPQYNRLVCSMDNDNDNNDKDDDDDTTGNGGKRREYEQQILVQVIPNTQSYESRMNVHIQQGNVEQADTILRQLANDYITQYKNNNQNNDKNTNTTTTTTSHNNFNVGNGSEQQSQQQQSQQQHAIPSSSLFYRVLQAWLRKDKPTMNFKGSTKRITTTTTLTNKTTSSKKNHGQTMASLLYLLLECYEYNPKSCTPTAAMFTMCIQECSSNNNTASKKQKQHNNNNNNNHDNNNNNNHDNNNRLLLLALDLLQQAESFHMTHMHAYACIIQQLLATSKVLSSSLSLFQPTTTNNHNNNNNKSSTTPIALHHHHSTNNNNNMGNNNNTTMTTQEQQEKIKEHEKQKQDCIYLAYQILLRMEQQQVQQDIQFAQGLYTSVIAALAQLGTFQAVDMAEDLLRGTPCIVHERMCTSVLHAYVVALRKQQKQQKQQQEQQWQNDEATTTENSQKRIGDGPGGDVDDDILSNNNNTWQQQEEEEEETPAIKALRLFRTMQSLDKDPASSVTLNEISFFTMFWILVLSMSTDNNINHPQQQQQLQVMFANEAQSLLTTMIQLSYGEGRLELEPTTRCCDLCFRILLKGQRQQRQQQRQQRQQQQYDNAIIVNHPPPHSSSHVESAAILLYELIRCYGSRNDPQLLPSPIIFDKVIKACKHINTMEMQQMAQWLEQAAQELFG